MTAIRDVGYAKLLNVAMNTASLYLVYDFGTACPDVCGSAAARAMSATGPAMRSTRFFLPAYTVADIFATYETKIDKLPVIYQFNVKNLFDKVYYTPPPATI